MVTHSIKSSLVRVQTKVSNLFLCFQLRIVLVLCLFFASVYYSPLSRYISVSRLYSRLFCYVFIAGLSFIFDSSFRHYLCQSLVSYSVTLFLEFCASLSQYYVSETLHIYSKLVGFII